MKQTLIFILVTGMILQAAAQNAAKPVYSKAEALQAAMDKYTAQGLPGVSLSLYTEQAGWWSGASGYANIARKTKMTVDHLQYTQSVSKTYLAVAVLKLWEEGKIDFEAPITKYLGNRYSKYIRSANKVTVRMLLNHTSGVPEYSTHPAMTSFVIEHPLEKFTVEDCLKFIEKEEPQFEPGSKYRYTNTNYQLLSLIVDGITGDHARYIMKKVIEPVGLKNTFYANNHSYLKNLPVTNSYWDVLNTGHPADVSAFQQTNVTSLKGDDGIVCTPQDAAAFLKALMEGRILGEAAMKHMTSFVKDEDGNAKYGMGLFYFDLGGIVAYGHGGGGVGAGCVLMYIPTAKMYLFFATNLGVLVDGDLTKKADALKNELFGILMQ